MDQVEKKIADFFPHEPHFEGGEGGNLIKENCTPRKVEARARTVSASLEKWVKNLTLKFQNFPGTLAAVACAQTHPGSSNLIIFHN